MTKPSIKSLQIGITALQTAQSKRARWHHTFEEMFDNDLDYSRFMLDMEAGMMALLKSIYHDDADILEDWVYLYNYGQNSSFLANKDLLRAFPFRTLEDIYEYFIQCLPDDY